MNILFLHGKGGKTIPNHRAINSKQFLSRHLAVGIFVCKAVVGFGEKNIYRVCPGGMENHKYGVFQFLFVCWLAKFTFFCEYCTVL